MPDEKKCLKFGLERKVYYICNPIRVRIEMVDVAQLVRVTDCGSEGRGFESHLPPKQKDHFLSGLFV